MSSHSDIDGKKKSSNKKKKQRVLCHKCNRVCTGEVLKVQERYFHTDCFYCKVCNRFLSSGGFYVRGEDYYCTEDYQKMFGTKCFVCHNYVEGEVVTALNNTYHKECFKCDSCKNTFAPGSTVTYDGDKYVCQDCLDPNFSPTGNYKSPGREAPPINSNSFESRSPYDSHFVTPYEAPPRRKNNKVKCNKCHQCINDSTLLGAMGKFWHHWCFTCIECKRQMHGRFVARGEEIYCESHYFKLYGVRCNVCHDYITGKSLMANEACYHFDCAKCAYCKRNFRSEQDLYKDSEGPRLWHQQCGLNSRQEYLNRTQSEELSTALSPRPGNTSDIPSPYNMTPSQLPVHREDSSTPTPPISGPEDLSLSAISGALTPLKVSHTRASSNELSLSRSKYNSGTTPTGQNTFQSTLSSSHLMQSLDTMDSPAVQGTRSAQSRRRVMSDTYNLRFNKSHENFRKAQEFFTSRENSTELLFPPRTGPSPRLQHSRQRSDLSSTSSGTDKRVSPISLSPQRSPGISDASTSTMKRTLKETQSHFTETIDERQEIDLTIHDLSTASNSSSGLQSVSSAPLLEVSTPDARRPLSFDDVPKGEQKTTDESQNYSQIRKKARTKSDLNSKSFPEQPAVYPLKRLLVTPGEYQVYPRDVDRLRLEQHLSAEDFFRLFSMTKEEFSVLPSWKQDDMKRKAKLF